MTREEAIQFIDNIKHEEAGRAIGKEGFYAELIRYHIQALNMAIKALSQEPCDDIAQERYKDLCEYFGGAKEILKSREDFKAWLGRVKWHIRKAEELYEKYEYKKEPCEKCDMEECKELMTDINGDTVYAVRMSDIRQLPPVTQKSGNWIDYRDDGFVECPFCGHATNCEDDIDELHYCFWCGARMVEAQERSDKE